MKNNKLLISLSLVLYLCVFLVESQASISSPTVVYSWQELTAAISEGTESIVLGSDIASDGTALISASNVTIDGYGFSMINTVIESGKYCFSDVILRGTSSIGGEDGTPALMIQGDNTSVVLSGNTSVTGGRSASDGSYGGCGIILNGDNQELILCNRTSVSGGTGRYRGGDAVQVNGCSVHIIIKDSASLLGAMGGNEGADALLARSCTYIQCQDQSSAAGGDGYLCGGNAIHIEHCKSCSANRNFEICDSGVLSGGSGYHGGCAIQAENADIKLAGNIFLFGGAGYYGGQSLTADHCLIEFQAGSMVVTPGASVVSGRDAFLLEDSEISGSQDEIIKMTSGTLSQNPAESVPEIVENELRKRPASEPILIEESKSITRYKLSTQHERLVLERSKLSQAKLNGTTLKIRVYNTTIEQMFSFNERFLEDGEDLYFVLIADQSAPGYTVTSSLAALKKLYQSGVTHLVYTSISPIYCERILDLGTIINDIDSVEYNVSAVHFGTADDCVIYLNDDGNPEYRLDLMTQAQRSVPDI